MKNPQKLSEELWGGKITYIRLFISKLLVKSFKIVNAILLIFCRQKMTGKIAIVLAGKIS